MILVSVLRPKTTPKSLLILYVSISLSQIVIVSERRPESRREFITRVIEILMSFIASFVIVFMPMRSPDLPNDEISPAFASPTFELRSPEDNITLWQFLTVSWMSPLISLGRKRQLNDEDVWCLAYEFQHKRLHEKFRELHGSVVQRLIRANAIDLVILTVLGILDLLASEDFLLFLF